MSSVSVSVADAVKMLGPDDASKVQRLLEKGIRIPPQPRVLEELRQLLLRENFDIRSLARVIGQDPAIVSMLFKVTGSIAYRRFHPFSSLEQILHSLGVKETCNLVMAITASGMSRVAKNRIAMEFYWARSQAIAQIAMLVANDRITVCNIFPDQAYLAAVFHDCGVPVLMDRFQSYCEQMHLGDPNCWIDLVEEDARFNADHSVVGYLVARHWNLPDFICEAIRYHHEYDSDIPYTTKSMVAILQLSTHIYFRDRRIDNPEWPLAEAEVLEELGIDAEGLPELIETLLDQYHEQTEEAA
jgi:HD-like signal output (HDOD) protein